MEADVGRLLLGLQKATPCPQSSASASVDAPAGSLIVTTLYACHHFPGWHLAVFLALSKPTIQWSLIPPMKEAAADRLSALPCCTDHQASGRREGPGPRRLDTRFFGVPPTPPRWHLSSVFSIGQGQGSNSHSSRLPDLPSCPSLVNNILFSFRRCLYG